MKQLVAGTLLAVGLLLLAFYFAPWRGAVAPRQPPPELREEPDLYLQEAVIHQYRDDGALHYRLAARRTLHFEASQLTRVERPDFTLYSPTQPPWTVNAKQGLMRQQRGADEAAEETIVLREEVVLRQVRGEADATTIRTSELHLYPERRHAETDRSVIIESHAGRTAAQGLEADLGSRFLRLKSDADGPVHTVIPPELFGR